MGVERDFLGVSCKERRSLRDVAGLAASSAVQWPCATTMCSQQQLAPLKASQEGRPTIGSFGYPSTSGFHLIPSTDGDHRSAMELPTQKSFVIDWRGARPFRRDATPLWGANTDNATLRNSNENKRSPVVSNHITFNKAKAMDSANGANMAVAHVNWQQGVGMVGTSVPLVGCAGKTAATTGNICGTPSKAPASTQMTIFYAGAVNVYDIPLDKAREIMFLAASESNIPRNATNMRQNVAASDDGVIRAMNINQARIDTKMESHSKDPPSPASVTSHYVGGLVKAENGIGQNIIDSTVVERFRGPGFFKALPMARKASLARFLEKRKERLANALPYISAQKSVDNVVANDVTSASKKSVATKTAFATSREPLSCLGTSLRANEPRSPNTKLEM